MKRLLLLILAALMTCGCEKVTKQVEIGYKGEARKNPLLAAQRYLRSQGYIIQDINHIRKMHDPEGTVFVSLHAFQGPNACEQLLNWVTHGGHMILLLEGAKPFQQEDSRFFSAPDSEGRDLLNKLDIQQTYTVTRLKTIEGEFHGAPVKLDSPLGFSWKSDNAPQGATIIGPKDSMAIASFPKGRGMITVVADAYPFRNRHIGDHQHAWLLNALVEQTESGMIGFLQGTGPSFWQMIWTHGWMALVSLAVLLIIWLWKHMPRFGPREVAHDDPLRHYTDHLVMTGSFLWANHESRALLLPLKRSVLGAVERLGWSATDRDLIDKVAARSGLPVGRVRNALSLESVTDPELFQLLVQDLQRIRESL